MPLLCATEASILSKAGAVRARKRPQSGLLSDEKYSAGPREVDKMFACTSKNPFCKTKCGTGNIFCGCKTLVFEKYCGRHCGLIGGGPGLCICCCQFIPDWGPWCLFRGERNFKSTFRSQMGSQAMASRGVPIVFSVYHRNLSTRPENMLVGANSQEFALRLR